MTLTLRCGSCDYWLGESAVRLVYIGIVPKGEDVTIQPPRDVRLCKACGERSVFIQLSELDKRRVS